MTFKGVEVRPRDGLGGRGLFTWIALGTAVLSIAVASEAVAQPTPQQVSAARAYQDQLEHARLLKEQVLALPDLPTRAPQIVGQIRDNLQQQWAAVQAGDLRSAHKLHRLVARQLRRVSRYVQRRLRQAASPPGLPRLRAYFDRLTKHALRLRDYARYEGLSFDATPVKQARQLAKTALDQQDLPGARAAMLAYRDAVEQLEDALKPVP